MTVAIVPLFFTSLTVGSQTFLYIPNHTMQLLNSSNSVQKGGNQWWRELLSHYIEDPEEGNCWIINCLHIVEWSDQIQELKEWGRERGEMTRESQQREIRRLVWENYSSVERTSSRERERDRKGDRMGTLEWVVPEKSDKRELGGGEGGHAFNQVLVKEDMRRK